MRLQPEYKTDLVRDLRKRQTWSEAALWERLRGRKLLGLKFRRQRPLERYIADFCCDEIRLIVEIDGGIHEQPEQRESDRERENFLRALGFTILRVSADDVLTDTDAIIEYIKQITQASVNTPTPPTTPLPLSPPLPPAKRDHRDRGPGGEGTPTPVGEDS